MAQTAPPSTEPVAESRPAVIHELPAEIRASLDEIEDFTPNFDHTGYYKVLAYVIASPEPPGFRYPPIEIDDWKILLDRPSEFRGLPITIEGWVERNTCYTHPQMPELGQVCQLELSRGRQPIRMTVICTTDASDIPLKAKVRVTGYFVKMRQLKPGQFAGLIVTPGPKTVERDVPTKASAPWNWIIGATAVGLVFGWVLLRRAVSVRRPLDPHMLRARHPASMNLADDLSEWAEDQAPEQAPDDDSR
ncbi:MAG: hypothetical protein JXO22_05775 [Phycisphaerae bacterium]|nr:hypothetical protein [Phycisphaerae bacterium]